MQTCNEQNLSNEDRRTDGRLCMGEVVAIRGSVVDLAFPPDAMPRIAHALEIEWDGPHRLVVEVQQHVDAGRVRGVALQETAGLKCGAPAHDTGGPVCTPVGDACLGRLLNVLGDPIDAGGAFEDEVPDGRFIALHR